MANFLINDNLSLSTRQSDFDESSAIIDYPNYDYILGIKLELVKMGESFEICIYSHRNGVERFLIDMSDNIDEIRRANIVKFRKIDNNIQIISIKSFVANNVCGSIFFKYNKDGTTIKIRTHAVLGLRERESDDYILWCDLLGDIRVPAKEIVKMPINFNQLETLGLVLVTFESKFKFLHGIEPKWKVTHFVPLLENLKFEEEETAEMPLHRYPVRCLRFDDIVFGTKMGEKFIFTSVSKQDIEIRASKQVLQLINSPGLLNNKRSIMTAVAFPIFGRDEKVYFEPLVIGSKEKVISITSEKIYSFRPKAFEPFLTSIYEEIMKAKKTMDGKALEIRAKPGFTFAS